MLALLREVGGQPPWRKCIVTPARQARSFVPWDKITAEPIRLKRGPMVKVATREGRKETTATLSADQWGRRLDEALNAGPCHLDVLAQDHDWHARRARSGRWLVTRSKSSLQQEPRSSGEVPGHDRVRRYPLAPNNERVRALFIEAGLYGKNGHLLGEAAGKYRQVQHYIELLRHLPVWDEEAVVRVVDAGCGKAYLSLALCLWAELNGVQVRLDGVDSSSEVVETAARIAGRAGLDQAFFHTSSVAEYAEAGASTDVLLSLHACDTATDEALAAGVRLNARVIVLVPCCHQELSDQMAANAKEGTLPAANRWQSTLRSGLLQHRLADIVTDSLRADALEALGYHVDVIEFVSPEATARNLMIRAVRREEKGPAEAPAFERYRALADEWAVKPALEGLLGECWPPS